MSMAADTTRFFMNSGAASITSMVRKKSKGKKKFSAVVLSSAGNSFLIR